MNFFDEVIINVKSGKGGDGCISFYRAKYIPKGGPDGGNGGDGGNIYLLSTHNINSLTKFNYKNCYIAENGENGKNNQRTGKKGTDLIIKIPIGTKVIDIEKKITIAYFKKNDQIFLIAKGGKGGLGNINFKSSINRTPFQNTKGEFGERKRIKLELILIADLSILGLPNTGKSTFLKKISTIKTKIGNYLFTTQKPILGVMKNKFNNSFFLILDVPGIMKGSSMGKGLGLNFIKHFQYCNLLLHFIDISIAYNEKIIMDNINIIHQEIKKNNKKIFLKEQWLVFNKIDLLNNVDYFNLHIKNIMINFKYIKRYYFISSEKNIGIKKLYVDILRYLNL
ncbi:Obg family GTPase CgtA [Enterobacteriaceae endosymbiont of Donacia tomentosa]|uniref:Obg family GTPase CgtA n=1 Tax=Enterobacteriaceae endosymbiont of Donacia tomentosa TaxID=2675787 RepID=UPI001448E7EC|nr:Obg family GTPase CgtA [Enterobacteriaceae endosymbiont of Donacia tomentosa]QJC31865.1 Obg family GTPase CgtA [Enterobacteriaceae endosymbiont of Donacia tomentosa]